MEDPVAMIVGTEAGLQGDGGEIGVGLGQQATGALAAQAVAVVADADAGVAAEEAAETVWRQATGGGQLRQVTWRIGAGEQEDRPPHGRMGRGVGRQELGPGTDVPGLHQQPAQAGIGRCPAALRRRKS